MRSPAKTQLGLNFDALPPLVHEETFDEALEMTFPVAEATEDELYLEFLRLFPLGERTGIEQGQKPPKKGK